MYSYSYPERLFEEHLLNEVLPPELHNTCLYRRSQKGIGKKFDNIQSDTSKVNTNLSEISSRWKIVSPDYCINCLGIIKPYELTCANCISDFSADRKRIESIQSEKQYKRPIFDDSELKWISKNSTSYIGSLAPDVGESQFEYRERLKWEFAENMKLKKYIKNRIGSLNALKSFQRQTKATVNNNGGYCGFNCRHCIEEFFNDSGAIVGDFDSEGYTEYYCRLGHPVNFGMFCKDYKL